MASRDHEEIANLLGVDNHSRWDEYQWKSIPDQNQGNYENPLSFDTLTWINNWMQWSRAYVSVPITLSCTMTAAAAEVASYGAVDANAPFLFARDAAVTPKLTLKNGGYSALNGMNLQINNNQIQNSQNLQIPNHLKAI